jgi:hypothetical protein
VIKQIKQITQIMGYISIHNPYIEGSPSIPMLSVGVLGIREIAIKRKHAGGFEFKLLVRGTYKKIFKKNPSKLNMPTPCTDITLLAEWDNLPDFEF